MIPRRTIALPALAVALAVGCGGEPRDPHLTVIATIGEEPVYLSDLNEYLSENLLAEHEELPVEDRNRVKSRLLDAYLDERILSAEALARGLDVSAVEVDAWLDFVSDDSDETVEERRREAVRRSLSVQKLEEEIVSNPNPPTDDEVRNWIAGHADRSGGESRVLLRSLRFEDLPSAESVHRDILRGRRTFDEAVVALGTSPVQGTAVEVGLASMIEEQRAALEGLRPGQVSKPVETSGGIYLFQVVSWPAMPAQPGEVRWRRAKEALERDRGAAAYRKEVARLRKKAGIRMNPGALPFTYVPEDSVP